MNILFTCGGTAGHVNPAVALARIFQERNPGCRVLFVGADGGMETRLVPKEGYSIETVTITNFRRSVTPANLIHNMGTVINMGKSKGQAKRILNEFKPDLVVGTGGYASYPVVRQAAARGIPTAVHESNAVPGLTTKALSKVVDRVMVGFEESRAHYDDPEKVVVTGTPVRGDFFRYTRQEAREKLGIDDERPLLLSYWGSLGAEAMNRQMVEFIAKECYEGAPCRHIHGAGRDYPWMQEELTRRGLKLGGNGVEVREYIYDMPLVMAAADLVLCRAGASTISEITAIAKPSILVPSPNVTANHQEKNARVLSDQGAAELLREKDCQGDALFTAAETLLRDRKRRDEMVRALNSMAVPDAGEKIYQTLLELMK
ncbi:MAG: undecaprenyldiphospho-muramoylpentapeptide beta-N-acetylglucosaminyltransferase [Clostridium sp.]|nr:undecaprenyldiphospho-muramoylpentapeptide beta-N-acetylglucosaminyltransferase [Clostridium sp.]